MSKVIVKVVSADYYDTIHIFVDGMSQGKQKGNSSFNIPISPGRHVISGIYDNMESEYRGIRHTIGPIEFVADAGDVCFEVKIMNIFAGATLLER